MRPIPPHPHSGDEYDDDLEDSLVAIDEAIGEVEAVGSISFEDFKREIRRDYGL